MFFLKPCHFTTPGGMHGGWRWRAWWSARGGVHLILSKSWLGVVVKYCIRITGTSFLNFPLFIAPCSPRPTHDPRSMDDRRGAEEVNANTEETHLLDAAFLFTARPLHPPSTPQLLAMPLYGMAGMGLARSRVGGG